MPIKTLVNDLAVDQDVTALACISIAVQVLPIASALRLRQARDRCKFCSLYVGDAAITLLNQLAVFYQQHRLSIKPIGHSIFKGAVEGILIKP
jgi:hypothetical protein